MMDISALTVRFNTIKNVITTDVKVRNLIGANIETTTKAIWDTGATNSCITKDLAQKLQLPIIGMTKTQGVHGIEVVPYYSVQITLHNENISMTAYVTECANLSQDKNDNIGMLIGMDVISKGDLSISNHGETIMTFRVPSIETTDYCKEIDEAKKYLKIHESQLTHGIKKCPCSSGKLWENCHGKYFK